MQSLGYSPDRVERGINYLGRALFEPYSSAGRRRFRIRKNSIATYESLLCNPAYLENMAVVTPISQGEIPASAIGAGYEPTDLSQRVRTTMLFLRQLQDDEVRFCEPTISNDLLSPSSFSNCLRQFSVPRLFPRAAMAYKKHLQSLQLDESRPPAQQWPSVMWDDPVFREAAAFEGSEKLEAVQGAVF